MDTPSHGAIHPRSKIHVGNRLGIAAYNTIYNKGKKAFTGPTLAGCKLASGSKTLNIVFNTTLLAGDKLLVNKFPFSRDPNSMGSSGIENTLLYAQINASLFCMEPQPVLDKTGKAIPGQQYCPTWAGGDGTTVYGSEAVANQAAIAAVSDDLVIAPPPPPPPGLDSSWIMLKYKLAADGTSIDVDLTPLNGSIPTAVRYAWGIIDCNDYSDPDLWITVSS